MEIRGLEELEKKFKKLQKESPDKFMESMDAGANFMKEHCKEETPRGPKNRPEKYRLRNSYKAGRTEYGGGQYTATVTNTARHAHLVEKGHNLVIKLRDGRKKTIGFVEGRYYIKKAYESGKDGAVAEVSQQVSGFIEGFN